MHCDALLKFGALGDLCQEPALHRNLHRKQTLALDKLAVSTAKTKRSQHTWLSIWAICY